MRDRRRLMLAIAIGAALTWAMLSVFPHALPTYLAGGVAGGLTLSVLVFRRP